jgi:SpoVK/Ycf46/Vps4 family AAA+-type ATPase
VVVPWERQYSRFRPFGWVSWHVVHFFTCLVRDIVLGVKESSAWLFRSAKKELFSLNGISTRQSTPRPLLSLMVIFVPIGVLAAIGPPAWFLNTPVLWLGALVLVSFLRGPMRGAPSLIRKLLKIGVATLVAFGLVILLMWEPVREAAKRAPPIIGGSWLLLVMLAGFAWSVSVFWILLATPKPRQFPMAAAPRQEHQEQARIKAVQNVPPERFADIGGMETAKEQIREIVQAQLRPEKHKRYGLARNGILLHGPRGTGKTFLARATAGEFGLNFEYVPAPELHSRWIGATGENIQARFARAAQRRPVLFFIDEIDSLGAARGCGGGGDEGGAAREFDNITTALFTSIDRYRVLSGFILMASTNRLDAVDPAVIREKRFDVMVRVDLPDERTRLAIFEKQLKKRPWKPFSLEEFAHKTPGASGAKIEAIVDRAAEFALRENRKIEQRDLSRAIDCGGGQDRPLVKHVGWADVVVDESVSQDLRSLIRLINDPAKTEKMGMRVPTGLLLIGPPGTGKTLIAELIASETNRSFYPLTAADVLGGNAGDSVKRVKSIFVRAKEHSPSLIFLDEMDGLLPTNSRFLSQHDVQVVEQFLTEISRLEPEHNVFLVGTTNHPENIDPRVLRGGRFSEKIVIGPPGIESRKILLSKYLQATRLEPGITIESIATQLDGRVPADLEAICITAKRMAFNRNGSAEEVPPLNWSDFEKAIQRVQGAA